MDFDIAEHNRRAWNRYAKGGIRWSIPVGEDAVKRAQGGTVEMLLTPTKFVPQEWFGELKGKRVLALASGGGQQTPLFAAAGAEVTVLDGSDEQLALDRDTCAKFGLECRCERGDMRDLGRFEDESFDLIFHPVSNLFVDDVNVVWRECARVLKRGGTLLAGFSNPIVYMFDAMRMEQGELVAAHRIPYSPFSSSAKKETETFLNSGDALEWGHSLSQQIGGQVSAGFAIVGFYEDTNQDGDRMALDEFTDVYIATRAVKL